MSEVVAGDKITRTRSLLHHTSDGGVVIEEQQDVRDVLEVNKAAYNRHDERTPFKKDIVKVAEIPNVVYWDLKRRGIIGDKKAFAKWLDDPDNRHFRTRPGKLSRTSR